ncbi:MAG: zf-HC2 domain-containing protein [Firmicutes bacterium]|nr:zf-HC2 domain-containing protein [Bacillota bacterium]
MTNKLPCYIVKDMLPLYADDLLSPESEKNVKEHLDECPDCGALYKQMVSPEPEISEVAEDKAEVDFLKKVNRKKKNLLIASALIVALVACGAFINARIQAAKADFSFDEASKTLVVYGKDDTDLKFPKTLDDATAIDAQFDSFHLKANLNLFRTDGLEIGEFLPQYLGRTNESIKFIKDYIQENCPDVDIAERAAKYVDMNISTSGDYTWTEEDDRIVLDIGNFYWHREELYIFSLLGSKSIGWKQLGYAWYLGTCIDPYNETLVQGTTGTDWENLPYYDEYVKGGGTQSMTPENYLKLCDASACHVLTNGMHWGTAYESWPITAVGTYNGPKKSVDPGNDMTVMMATSFIGYLSNQYGFDKVSDLCFSNKSFTEAFGTDWQTEYDNWSAWIMENYGA